MPKISGLIFSADPINETISAAKHLLEFTDEVVVVYAKSYKDYKKFISRNRDKRIRIFYAIRLGYPEPFRHYGISLCRYDHIAMLDVDERFSDTEYAKELLDSNKAAIYLLWRHEVTGRKLHSQLYTKQYRLFKKGSLEWKGLLHETPLAKDSMVKVPKDKLCVIHKTGKVKSWNYNKLNEVFPVEMPIKMAIRDAYVERGFKHLSMGKTLDIFIKKYRKHKADTSSIDMARRKIIHLLQEEGMIRYLNLDSKKHVDKINAKYIHSKVRGIDLLIKLLYKRYNEKR
jgi:hypothetical protein